MMQTLTPPSISRCATKLVMGSVLGGLFQASAAAQLPYVAMAFDDDEIVRAFGSRRDGVMRHGGSEQTGAHERSGMRKKVSTSV